MKSGNKTKGLIEQINGLSIELEALKELEKESRRTDIYNLLLKRLGEAKDAGALTIDAIESLTLHLNYETEHVGESIFITYSLKETK